MMTKTHIQKQLQGTPPKARKLSSLSDIGKFKKKLHNTVFDEADRGKMKEKFNSLFESKDTYLAESVACNTLTEDDKKTLIAEATLDQFSRVFEGINALQLKLKEFFGNQQFSEISYMQSLYMHHIMQYNIVDFFQQEEYCLVYLTRFEENFESDPMMGKVALNREEKFEVYNCAVLFLINPETGSRICVNIDLDFYRKTTNYTLNYAESDPEASEFIERWIKFSKKNNFYKGQAIDANCGFLDLEDVTWDDVVLPALVRDQLKKNVENIFEYSDILVKNNIKLKRGLILAGPPGTGKTMVCKALAKELDCTILYVLPSHIENIGDIERICNMASGLSPTLMILEDVDGIAMDREEMHNTLVIELMNQLDGLEKFENVITLATTNIPEKVEKAIKDRPGRFDRVIQLPKPDADGPRVIVILPVFLFLSLLNKFVKFNSAPPTISTKLCSPDTPEAVLTGP